MRPRSASDNLWFLLKFELFWQQQGGNESVLDTRPSQVAWGFEEHVFGLLSSNVLRDQKKKKKHFATRTDRSRCLSVPRVSFPGNDSSHRHDWHSVFPPNGHAGSKAILLQTVSLTFFSHLRRVWQAASRWIFLRISVKAQRWLECVLCSTQQHLGRAGQGIISSFKRVWLRVTAAILIASTQVMCKLLKQRRPEGPLYILKDGSSLSLSLLFHKVYFIQKLQPSLSLTLAVLCNLVVMVLCVQQVREALYWQPASGTTFK